MSFPFQNTLAIGCWTLWVLVSTVLAVPTACGFQASTVQDSTVGDGNPLLVSIQEYLQENPDHSDSWRMLGKIQWQQGAREKAICSLEQALQLAPQNAAAHFDLGQLQGELKQVQERDFHFQRVLEIAPQSEYAQRIHAQGFQFWLPTEPATSVDPTVPDVARIDTVVADAAAGTEIEPVGYEIQTFDGSDDLQRRLEQLAALQDPDATRWRIFAETGALYNSNITLTPISRQLSRSDAASAQWIANTELEWLALRRNAWRFGPLARGYFSVNESQWSDLNLSSFQGGTFLERDLQLEDQEWITRFDYVYAIDQFGGQKFGDRHALNASLTHIGADCQITHAYFNLNTTQFIDDGLFPSATSQDGPAWMLGISRLHAVSWYSVSGVSCGLDFESAQTEGDDFRFWSMRGYADTTLALADTMDLTFSGGLGFRNYPDFTGPVNRDELTWRTAARLDYWLRPGLSVSLVANYDSFVSDNVDFDVDRFTAGILTTFRDW